MSLPLTVNGNTYQYPDITSKGGTWGAQATGWAQAVTGVLTMLGAPSAPAASTGQVKLGNGDKISWRNAANTLDMSLFANASDHIIFFDGVTNKDLSLGGGNLQHGVNSVDNEIVRFDGTNNLVQNSGVTIDDAFKITTPGDVQGLNLTAIAAINCVSLVASGNISGVAITATGQLTFSTINATSLTTLVTALTAANADAIAAKITSTGTGSLVATATAANANTLRDKTTRSTGVTPGQGGVAISTSSGAFTSTAGATLVDVTNLTVTLTTSGRPVRLCLVPDGTANHAFLGTDYGEGTGKGHIFAIKRDATVISRAAIFSDTSTPALVPPSCIEAIDAVTAGTYVYKVQIYTSGVSAKDFFVYYCKLVAYEL
jgi:hypothetical protein